MQQLVGGGGNGGLEQYNLTGRTRLQPKRTLFIATPFLFYGYQSFLYVFFNHAYACALHKGMGRVSRYKRIKSCDPFYKGPKKDLDK